MNVDYGMLTTWSHFSPSSFIDFLVASIINNSVFSI